MSSPEHRDELSFRHSWLGFDTVCGQESGHVCGPSRHVTTPSVIVSTGSAIVRLLQAELRQLWEGGLCDS